MSEKNKGRMWILIIAGLLLFGIYMIVWTVRSAMSVPVHESNNFMLKYQTADRNSNALIQAQKLFENKYNIELQNMKPIILAEEEQNLNSKIKQEIPMALKQGENSFSYRIEDKEGKSIENAKVSFLLTRPHTEKDDMLDESLTYQNESYQSKAFNINKAGRYTLQLRVKIDNAVGYRETSAYLKP